MKYFKAIFIVMIFFGLLFGADQNKKDKERVFVVDNKEIVHINFTNLKVEDLINLTSKVINKNILITTPVTGEVNFIANTPIYKDELLDILIYVLESKGYTLVGTPNDTIYRLVRSAEASSENLPIISSSKRDQIETKLMLTEVFLVKEENVDIVASKIRHLLSKSAKLITSKENNSILLTDYPKNIETAKKAIDLIQEAAKREMITVELKNLKAFNVVNDIQRVAQTLFNNRIDTEKVDIVPNKDSNTIMLIGKKENIEILKEHLLDLDKKASLAEKIVEVLPLKNADAKNMLSVMNDILAKKQYQDPLLRPSVSADLDRNALIIIGVKEEINDLKKIIDELDKEKQQVYVRARIVEISEKKTEKLGLKYGLEGGSSTTSGLFTFAANMGGTSITLSDRLINYIKTPNISEGLALGAAIDLLASHEAADIISEPSILCIDNKESTIYVGQTESILQSAITGENKNDLTRSTFKREDIGLTLKVKPRISNDDKVTLEVTTKLEDVLAGTGGTGTPTTTKREVNTVALVSNGESVIVGGLIKDKVSQTENKVPILGDIPILGNLFKNNTDAGDKVNLVIVLTPYIIPKSSNLSQIRELLSDLDNLQREYTLNAIKRLKLKSNLEDYSEAK